MKSLDRLFDLHLKKKNTNDFNTCFKGNFNNNKNILIIKLMLSMYLNGKNRLKQLILSLFRSLPFAFTLGVNRFQL